MIQPGTNKNFGKELKLPGVGGQLIFSVGTADFYNQATLPYTSSSLQTVNKEGETELVPIDDEPDHHGVIGGIRNVDPTVDEF